jgi:broad specificity phosphatase PhoE
VPIAGVQEFLDRQSTLPALATIRLQELILARHAQSTANVEGIICAEPTCSVDLTEEGRHQAKGLAQLLERKDIALCVTSELSRSLKTAEIALAGRPIPRLIVADFNDPLVGRFEHTTAAEFNEWLARKGATVPTPQGESQQDALHRYMRAYEMLLSRQEDVILAVIHRLPILWLLSAIPGDPLQDIDYAAPIYLRAADVRKAIATLRSRPPDTMSY